LPIPDRSWTRDVLNSINPKIDVDCLTQISMKKIKKRKNIIYPPTPSAILEILNNLKVRIKNKKICIIGKGILVGGPLSIILSNLKAHVTVCDSQTKDIKEKCLASDIIICGVGKPNIVTKEMVKNGQIVIDAGTYCKNKKTYGGVDFKNVKKIAKHITPTPGGVGPITVAKLLENTLTLTKKLK
jgi:methylenetetrahydrofolate dehydrogenase (NADP+)/methenyltetrahydrofolate cyclohydrolase